MNNPEIKVQWDIIALLRRAMDGEAGKLLSALEIFGANDVIFDQRATTQLYDLKAQASGKGMQPIANTIDEMLIASGQMVTA